MGRRGHTKEFKAQVLECYVESNSLSKTAEKFGVSRMTVRRWAKEAGGITLCRSHYGECFKADVVAHYVEFGSSNKTAEKFSVSNCSVLSWSKAAGVDTSDASRVSRRFKAKVVAHYVESNSLSKTSKAFGVSNTAVWKWAQEAGVDTSRKYKLDPNRCVKQYLRGCQKYKAWRKRVIARDGKKCRHCGSTRRLQVDHITPFNELFNRAKGRLRNKDKIREACLNYAPMWRANNGRVLCEDCHKQTATWGSGSTDGAQVDLI